jgi:3-deoxy-7-phosphoheptulonate synthase
VLLEKNGLPPYLMVDCSHANSLKDANRQPEVAAAVAAQVAAGERAICALMIESNLLGGAQDFSARPLVYGRSITDACLAWEHTLPVFANLAAAVRARRARSASAA